MHVLPASAKKTYTIDETELAKLPVKKQKQIKRKMDASSSTFSWNSLYMNVGALKPRLIFMVLIFCTDRCSNVFSCGEAWGFESRVA